MLNQLEHVRHVVDPCKVVDTEKVMELDFIAQTYRNSYKFAIHRRKSDAQMQSRQKRTRGFG